ncbi:MAG: PBSX family phage terminase large subunit [Defluviitaleaceae bacterium]|nr:PBSX family phage terminase large subunit [Defluviitaleaceae bacterium]
MKEVCGNAAVDVLKVIAPPFHGVHADIGAGGHTHYWLKGGRGSTKSSFVSIEIIWGIMQDPDANAVVMRKVGKTLRQSVYEQMLWASELFGPEDWKPGLSPLELTYLPTGGKIIFRGADEPRKLKSTKFKQGYCKFVWFEELEEFRDMEEIRSVTQSLIRGGDRFAVFYSFNPPKSRNSWINRQLDALAAGDAADVLVHHSTYLDVDSAWLGEQFGIEAEQLRKINPTAYAHEYLGEVTGTGGEIFENLQLRQVSDEEIAGFERALEGVDWGFATDPFVWVRLSYDKTRRVLYIFDEIYRTGLSNRAAAEMILERGGSGVIADSAEPKSIAEFNELGVRARKAAKGPGSLGYGMKFLTLEVAEIVIDPRRCPHTAREFNNYEYERDENGVASDAYPDKNNHAIDAVRYALEPYMKAGKSGGVRFVKGL